MQYFTVISVVTFLLSIINILFFVKRMISKTIQTNIDFWGQNIGQLFVLFITSAIFYIVIKEIYHWNNGYSRKNGKPWIYKSEWSDGLNYIAGDNESIKLYIEYFKPKNYDLEKAKIKLKNHKLIKNLSGFN